MLETGLLHAMKNHPYEKISLTDLCRQLEIPRKSFYRYFPTKDDCLLALIDHTLADCNAVVLTGWEGDRELKQVHLMRFFSYWRNQEAFLDAVRDNGFCYLLLDRTTVIVDAMKESDQSVSFAQNQIEYFIAHGLMASVLRWHHYGFQGTAEEMAQTFAKFLHSPEVSITRLML
jgi:AcrR family transcriptional regulator